MPRSTFDIFLSSTSADLRTYRAKVTEMIGRMRQMVIRMESFGARPTRPLATCKAEVESCDALIVVVGHRYGWVPDKNEGGDGVKSITWYEVQWALDRGKPVYAFLVDPNAPWSGEREQDQLATAKSNRAMVDVGRAVQHLQQFKGFLEKNTTRELFTSAEDLAAKVATSLHPWLLDQAVAAARAALTEEANRLLPAPPLAPPVEATSTAAENLYWQEALHLLSAQRLVRRGEGMRLALIAGRANTQHPVLTRAAIQHFDARHHREGETADDFTTALAALLVGDDASGLYCGVAPAAELLIVQVLDDTYRTTEADLLAGIQVALTEDIRVVCLPLGGVHPSDAFEQAFQSAAELSMAIICPAGNQRVDTPEFPAAYSGCLSVAAVDLRGRPAFFTNFGDWVTTAAPGVDILAAVDEAGFRVWAGTSFSCGTVAGVVALMFAANPDLKFEWIRDFLAQFRLPPPEGISVSAGALLDAHAAVVAAKEAGQVAAQSPGRPERQVRSRRRKGHAAADDSE
jgi:hypothetical protein